MRSATPAPTHRHPNAEPTRHTVEWLSCIRGDLAVGHGLDRADALVISDVSLL